MGQSKEIYMEIEQLRNAAKEGEINELDAYIQLQDIEKYVKEAKDEVKPLAINQCLLYSEKTFDHLGRKVTYSEKATWSYKHCKQWNDIDNKRKELENKMKAAYTMKLDTDSETGETITPAEVKYTPTITIK